MVEGGMKCVKYLLFVFNLLFFLIGLGLIIVGGVVQARFSSYVEIFGHTFSAAAILLIVVGAVIFVIGFFGCCGAYRENYCMTMTFASLLALIFILEIAAGIAAYAMKGKVNRLITHGMKESLDHYKDREGVRKAWNLIQEKFTCCGVKNYTDWQGKMGPGKENSVPDSCCKTINSTCGKDALNHPAKLQQTGCMHDIKGEIKHNIVTIGGVGIGLAFVQALGIILACCLARTIKKEYEVV